MTGTDNSTAHTTPTAHGRTTRPATPTAPDGTGAGHGPRTRPADAPGTAPSVPRPRRAPADRRPLGPAGSGPGASGRSGSGGRGPGSAGRGGSAGSGPGSAGRSTGSGDRATDSARTASRLARPAAAAAAESRRARTRAPATPINAAGAPLPTVGAQRRAHESRPHHWFAQQLVLALSGQRPVHALLGHALPAAYDRLAELAPQTPLRPATGPGRRGPAPTVRDCGLCRPRRGVIEAFARISAGERLRALAFRLELGADSRWRCAALDIGPAAPALGCPAS
ncbi:Rv3235 family protein [Streptomyces sp. NPDC048637]|uniref:Rv3235 family protein n=1 Tax=Streptomyces sp. NPDC048637 TaxID=3155636 RepID=UPI003414658B